LKLVEGGWEWLNCFNHPKKQGLRLCNESILLQQTNKVVYYDGVSNLDREHVCSRSRNGPDIYWIKWIDPFNEGQ